MDELGWILAIFLLWLLAAVAVLTTVIVLDFLVLGRHGRLDWIANLFRRQQDEDRPRRKHVRKTKGEEKL